MIELSEPVSDPETFAQEVRGLIHNQKLPISLWNALTTVAVLYHSTRSGEKIIELLNYAEEPLRVQVRVKGSFSRIQYAAPEDTCCRSLSSTLHDGFTEFVVPALKVAGRVYLSTRPAHAAAKR